MWQTETIQIKGQPIAYVRQGTGDPLVMLHGFPTCSYLFHGVIPLLAEHFAVYALDLMGYGDSRVDPETPVDLMAQTDMLGAFADALGLKPFVLVGHDLGGGIGQIAGIEHPGWLRAMVLINTVMDDNFPIGRIARLITALRIPGIPFLLKRSPLLRWWARSPFGIRSGVVEKSVIDDQALDAFLYIPFLHSPAGIERFFRIVRAQKQNGQIMREIASRLDEIETPLLILWGDRDPYFDLSTPRRLMRVVPGAQRFRIIFDAGHFCPLEKTRMIAEHICAFCHDL